MSTAGRVLPLLSELSGASPQVWTQLFASDELRLLKLADPATQQAIRLTVAPPSANLDALLGHAAATVACVVNDEQGSGASEQLIKQACGALHLSQLCCHCAASTLHAHHAAAAVHHAVEGSGMMRLLDCTVDLIAGHPNVDDRMYDLLVEACNLLLVALSPQLYHPFVPVHQAAEDGSSAPPAPTVTLAALIDCPQSPPTQDAAARAAQCEQRLHARQGAVASMVHVVMTWFIERPAPPSLDSNPSTAAAVATHQALDRDRREAARAASASTALVSGAPMLLTRAHRRWLQGLRDVATSVFLVPLLPVLRIFSFFAGKVSDQAALPEPARGEGGGSGLPSTPTAAALQRTTSSDRMGGANGKSGRAASNDSPLADRAVLLLLLLVHNHSKAAGRHLPGGHNAFREALSALRDPRFDDYFDPSQGDPEAAPCALETGAGGAFSGGGGGGGGTAEPARKLSFDKLVECLSLVLAEPALTEPSALLLYSLLHSNPTFHDTLMSRSDLETLVLPLLERLYFADRERGNASLYVVVVVLLTFSQDSGFNATAFQHLYIPAVHWYSERFMRSVSLGSLTVLCVLRMIVYNLGQLNDSYLLENCLAILSNLAPHMEGLHPYTSQRLVAVTITAMKKYNLFANRLAALQAAAAPPAPREAEQLEQMLMVYGRCLQTLMSCLNTCLRRKQIHKNATLIYVLLHKQREMEEAASHPCLADVLQLGVVPSLIAHVNQRLERVEGDLSVEKTTEVIERCIAAFVNTVDGAAAAPHGLGGTTGALNPEPGKISYEEQADADAFFVPYTWEVIHVHTTRDLQWRTDRIAVFATANAAAAETAPASTAEAEGPAVLARDLDGQHGAFVGTAGALPRPDLTATTSDLSV